MGQVFKIGIVGLGAIGARLAQQIHNHNRTSIVAVCDLSESIRNEAAAKWNATPYEDYKTMLASETLDVVYVAVPPKYHHQVVMDVMKKGIHVLCEKPLSLSLTEAEEMESFARENGIVTAMNLPLHYDESLRSFARLVKSPKIGEVKRAELNLVYPEWPRKWQQSPWVGGREQGGPVRETAPHWFHIILRDLGEVARVRADVHYPYNQPDRCELDALGVLELKNGIHVAINVLTNLPRPENVSLTVLGSSGAVSVRDWVHVYYADGMDEYHSVTANHDSENVPSLLDDFVAALDGEPTQVCSFQTGLAIQKILSAWERAASTGNWETIK